MPLHTTIIRQENVSSSDREAMFSLQLRHYDGVAAGAFACALADKDWVIQLRDSDGKIVGFSTQKLFRIPAAGRERSFLFSGDTIVSPEHWMESTLAGAFGHLMKRVWEETAYDCHWFLITKGFRTYRFLPVFFKHFIPWHGQTAAEWELADLLKAVAQARFGKDYDPCSGLITPAGGDRLCPELAAIPESRRRDPHVSYFVARNPRYAQGVELACLASIDPDNLNRAGRRVIDRARVEWRE
ncbi:MAG: hypothetical protein RRC34_05630 [Lentisphaeria bacterium]|nr:hypothetical protein [Lentisphaeria bacterium]